MAKKTLSFMIASVLAVVLFLGMASAALTISSSDSITLNQNELSKTFTLNTDDNATFSLPAVQTLTDSDDNVITLTFVPLSEVNLTSMEYSVTATGDTDSFNFPESEFVNIEFTAINLSDSADNTTKTIQFIFENVDYCGTTTNIGGDLILNIEDIKVIDGFGDDDNFWYPFDEIEVELKIDNDGNSDIDRIEIEWELYNTAGKKIMDGNENDFNLKDGDDNTITFTFVLDENVDDFDGEEAVLYVRAKGKIDDKDSEYDNNYTCDSESLEVEVVTNDDFVIVKDLKIGGIIIDTFYEDTLSCGQEVTVSGKLWNIQDSDQDDVILEIYNKDLGILDNIEFSQIDAFDSEDFSYTFIIPDNSDEKSYSISFEVFDDGNDIYENSENDLSEEIIVIKVDSCSIEAPWITATLDSIAKAGEEMVMTVSITNFDSNQVVFDMGAEGYGSWSELVSMNPTRVVLGAGANQKVQYTFKLNKDSEGEHTFNILASVNGELIQSQAVMVEVEKSSFNLERLLGDFDWKLGLIILINLILVVAIIVVAVRIKRR